MTWNIGAQATAWGLEYILAHDTASTIKVQSWVGPIYENVAILSPEQRKRITIVPLTDKADYFITNFRYHPEDYGGTNIFYNYRSQNSSVLRIYKTK
jgi:hypothetical protein